MLMLFSDRIRVFQDKILAILGLQPPNPNQTHNSDEFSSKFMFALYELMEKSDRFVNSFTVYSVFIYSVFI